MTSTTDDLPDITSLILTVRQQRVLLAADLARVYGVTTKALNQAVKRNPLRFPTDFAFRLDAAERDELRRLRSQFVTLKQGQHSKYPELAFTEHGAIMAASLLNSPRAVQMSLFVVRAFVSLRSWATGHRDVLAKLSALETRVSAHDRELQAIIRGLRELMQPPGERKRVGFSGLS